MRSWDFELIKGVAKVLSDNYPERLGGAYVYPSGVLLAGLWKIVAPFFDPRTRAKVKMLNSEAQLRDLVPEQFIPKIYGGTDEFVFDPASVADA